MPDPVFRYHPDPIATESAVPDDHVCAVCGVRRQTRYDGPIYGSQPESVCLHCIHSGEAARALATPGAPEDIAASFSDAQDVPAEVPIAVVDEITQRTPGFTAWQQGYWLYHCADGAAFLGPAGYAELEPHPDALDSIRADCRIYDWPEDDIEEMLHQLDRDGSPTAYLFRCLHCGTHLASWDCH
ncbi:CbrC family protein [Pseudonocardia sp. TRM90224]|uniref:CbrC family protein n=1 Tax=Pseudonocardia sp. TRM90224 TaxID=2812678 RepID=UPI001E330B9C|nr:CbrC family protein [Pseudonocardia sp. TRM90224]